MNKTPWDFEYQPMVPDHEGVVPCGWAFDQRPSFDPNHRDTFGWCPTTTTIECDARGVYLRSWCKIETWRNLTADLWEQRARLWLRCSEKLRNWHLEHYDGTNDEPVFRP